MARLHIALVTEELPFAQVAGHQRVNMALVEFLRSRGHKVSILLTAPRLPAPILRNPHPDILVAGPGTRTAGGVLMTTSLVAFVKLSAKWVVEAAPLFVQYLVQRLRAGSAQGDKEILGKFPTTDQIEWIARWIAAEKPDAILIDTIFRCPVVPHLKAPLPKIFVLTHDVFHLRHASLMKRGLRLKPAELTREQEQALLSPADVIVAINADEHKVLSELLRDRCMIEVAMPVKLNKRPDVVTRDPMRCLFVGSGAAHNVDGLRWFLAEVWPLVRQAVPDARLSVLGLASRGLAFAPAGVTLHGRIDDLTAHYHRAGLSVCPLRAGSGLKIKMLEYFAHGLGCVTTSLGARGFVPSDAPPYVVADEARDFAEAIVGFMRDPARIAAFEACAYAYCAHYSEERVFEPLLRHLPGAA